MAVGTDGRLLLVTLMIADISDSVGAHNILDAVRKRWPWLKHLFADGAYDRGMLAEKATCPNFVIGFKILPRHWVVECTIGLMTRSRRLVRDYEEQLDVFMIHGAIGSLLLRRVAH